MTAAQLLKAAQEALQEARLLVARAAGSLGPEPLGTASAEQSRAARVSDLGARARDLLRLSDRVRQQRLVLDGELLAEQHRNAYREPPTT